MSMKNPVDLRLMMLFMENRKMRCLPKEREALLQFKAAIVNRYTMLSSWTTPDCCQWEGIRCSNVTAHIIGLDLHGDYYEFHVRGEIHKCCWSCHKGSLSHLEYLNLAFNSLNLVKLDLSANHLEGSTSSHSGVLMHSLSYLDLSANNFKARDLKSFINISTLHSLYMDSNILTEDLPSILGNLSSGCVRQSLQELYLRGNYVTGTLFDISVFSSLKSLFLSGNQLSGRIPEGVKLPSTLEDFSIRSNSLEGGIPKTFGEACSLFSLDMSFNSLSDELPMIISHLSRCARYSLQELRLNRNQINGTLPDFSAFTSLQILYLSDNMLNGEIPKDIQFPPKMESLFMNANSLKGVLTDYHFANMSKLEHLYLSDNSLIRFGIYSKLGSFFSIAIYILEILPTQNKFVHIDISNATKSDIIPEWFWAKLVLQKVMTVDISSNNLQGTIPNVSSMYASTYIEYADCWMPTSLWAEKALRGLSVYVRKRKKGNREAESLSNPLPLSLLFAGGRSPWRRQPLEISHLSDVVVRRRSSSPATISGRHLRPPSPAVVSAICATDAPNLHPSVNGYGRGKSSFQGSQARYQGSQARFSGGNPSVHQCLDFSS
ncbi:hypothetical protein V8G54_012745 [Vigna mungo]|uniref:Leucine-rich repeat-containing N-terminal plant-type domain-containing protein n=1 Tax=Vigna mungo TaxID=3915 RepID=A0AAQ3NSF1_VIGMU